jgi:hypothetical protein
LSFAGGVLSPPACGLSVCGSELAVFASGSVEVTAGSGAASARASLAAPAIPRNPTDNNSLWSTRLCMSSCTARHVPPHRWPTVADHDPRQGSATVRRRRSLSRRLSRDTRSGWRPSPGLPAELEKTLWTSGHAVSPAARRLPAATDAYGACMRMAGTSSAGLAQNAAPSSGRGHRARTRGAGQR